MPDAKPTLATSFKMDRLRRDSAIRGAEETQDLGQTKATRDTVKERLGDLIAGLEPADEATAVRLLGAARQS